MVSVGICSVFPNKKIEEYQLFKDDIKTLQDKKNGGNKEGFENEKKKEMTEEEKKKKQAEEDEKNRKNGILEMKRPFLNIYDDKGNRVNVVFITHPFSRKDCEENYEKGKKRRNTIHWDK